MSRVKDSLGSRRSMSVKILRKSSREKLEKILKDPVNLGEMAGLSEPEIETANGNIRDLINVWTRRTDLDSSIGHLLSMLANIACEHEISTLETLLETDVKAEERRILFDREHPSQERQPSSPVAAALKTYPSRISRSVSCSTVHDVPVAGSPPGLTCKFDVVVSASDDCKEADDIVDRLREDSGFTVCDFRKDILPGSALYPAQAEIMDIRTAAVVIMLDRHYQLSETCSFQVTFAQYLDPDARRGKVIPLVLEEDCDVPAIIRCLELMDFSSDEIRSKNWDRLERAIICSIHRDQELEELSNSLKHVL